MKVVLDTNVYVSACRSEASRAHFALCARRIGATLLTYNARDFRLIRRHKEFALRVLGADAA
jgi:predicted nucleic acid-binding protein